MADILKECGSIGPETQGRVAKLIDAYASERAAPALTEERVTEIAATIARKLWQHEIDAHHDRIGTLTEGSAQMFKEHERRIKDTDAALDKTHARLAHLADWKREAEERLTALERASAAPQGESTVAPTVLQPTWNPFEAGFIAAIEAAARVCDSRARYFREIARESRSAGHKEDDLRRSDAAYHLDETARQIRSLTPRDQEQEVGVGSPARERAEVGGTGSMRPGIDRPSTATASMRVDQPTPASPPPPPRTCAYCLRECGEEGHISADGALTCGAPRLAPTPPPRAEEVCECGHGLAWHSTNVHRVGTSEAATSLGYDWACYSTEDCRCTLTRSEITRRLAAARDEGTTYAGVPIESNPSLHPGQMIAVGKPTPPAAQDAAPKYRDDMIRRAINVASLPAGMHTKFTALTLEDEMAAWTQLGALQTAATRTPRGASVDANALWDSYKDSDLDGVDAMIEALRAQNVEVK